MKILHLFSNWKWTGPAELAVNLCRALSGKHEIVFICGNPSTQKVENEIFVRSTERGVAPLKGFRLRKHFHPIYNFLDWLKIRRVMNDKPFNLIHDHLPNDHLLAGFGRIGMKRKPLIIRSYYSPLGPEDNHRSAFLLSRFTEGALVISEAGRSRLTHEYGFPEDRSALIHVGIDMDRFDPNRFNRDQARREFGLSPDDFVLGIVARMQRHRRFEVLLEAMRQAAMENPNLKLMIVGRGTHQEEVAIQPVREMNLEGTVLFTGYLQGEEYVKALRSMDGALFLVPGSDGSCRAVREKMAMGVPVIASDIPPLDELIVHGESGYLVKLSVEGFKEAMLKMASQGKKTRAMGRCALEQAKEWFSLEHQAAQVDQFYSHIIERVTRP